MKDLKGKDKIKIICYYAAEKYKNLKMKYIEVNYLKIHNNRRRFYWILI